MTREGLRLIQELCETMSILNPTLVVEAQVIHVESIPKRTTKEGTEYPARAYAWLFRPGEAPDKVKIDDPLIGTFESMEVGTDVKVRIDRGDYEGRPWAKIAELLPLKG